MGDEYRIIFGLVVRENGQNKAVLQTTEKFMDLDDCRSKLKELKDLGAIKYMTYYILQNGVILEGE